MQKKGKKFDWNQKCEDSFKNLKTLLTNAPILRIADTNKDFIVCTDACNDSLGGVLTQEGLRISCCHTCLKNVVSSFNRKEVYI